MTDDNNQDTGMINNAADVIERFGGIRPMAAKMAVPVTTVQGWKKRGVIPGNRREDVLRAAESNNIDIAGVIESGAANENAGGFSAAISEATRATDYKKHEQAIAAGRQTIEQEETLMRKLSAVERRAVQKSALTTVILIIMTGALAGVLLWPSQSRIANHEKRLGVLEQGVDEVREEQSFLKSIMPENWQESLAQIQDQAAQMQEKVATLAAMAENVVGADAGPLSQRIGALEEQVQSLGAPADLMGIFEKLRQLQATVEGQQQLAGTVSDLSALVTGLQGRMENLDGALNQAQQEDGALGQTLEGVSPTDLKAAALLVGLSQFRASLKRSAPFEEDLMLLQKMVAKDDPELNAAIERLAPKAKEGVLSPEGLSNEFRGVAGEIVISSLKGEDVSMKEKAVARLNEMLQIQKDGELVTGTDTQATVARAQKMLDDGNVEGAIAELQTLQGDAAQTALPWMEDAQATLMAQKLQDMMTAKVGGAIGTTDLKGILHEIENTVGGGARPVDLGGLH